MYVSAYASAVSLDIWIYLRLVFESLQHYRSQSCTKHMEGTADNKRLIPFWEWQCNRFIINFWQWLTCAQTNKLLLCEIRLQAIWRHPTQYFCSNSLRPSHIWACQMDAIVEHVASVGYCWIQVPIAAMIQIRSQSCIRSTGVILDGVVYLWHCRSMKIMAK